MLKDNGLYKLNVAKFGKSKSKLTVDVVVVKLKLLSSRYSVKSMQRCTIIFVFCFKLEPVNFNTKRRKRNSKYIFQIKTKLPFLAIKSIIIQKNNLLTD